MKRAVFLDRDGVIFEERNHLHKKNELKIVEQSADGIKLLNDQDYLVFIVTNQPVVARGLCTEEEVKEINEYAKEIILKNGAEINGIYYCPHHPTAGINPNYTKVCECRKPKPGMILQAKKDWDIEKLSECFMIGDTTTDIMAGKNAGCKTILVETGYGGNDNLIKIKPDYKSENLYQAVIDIILK